MRAGGVMGRLSSTKGNDSSAKTRAVAVKGSTDDRKESGYAVEPVREISQDMDDRTVWDEV
jgi:hypothetical protein